MTMERPWNEYEGAFFMIATILLKQVIAMGADRKALAEKFNEAAEAARLDRRESEAAIHDMFARAAAGDAYYAPGGTGLRVIPGGKDDPLN